MAFRGFWSQFGEFWEVQKVFRNLDPSLHPQERAHEYVRAVNAAKLDKVIYWLSSSCFWGGSAIFSTFLGLRSGIFEFEEKISCWRDWCFWEVCDWGTDVVESCAGVCKAVHWSIKRSCRWSLLHGQEPPSPELPCVRLLGWRYAFLIKFSMCELYVIIKSFSYLCTP